MIFGQDFLEKMCKKVGFDSIKLLILRPSNKILEKLTIFGQEDIEKIFLKKSSMKKCIEKVLKKITIFSLGALKKKPKKQYYWS